MSLPALAQRLESEWGAGHVASMQIMHPAGESPYINVRRASTSTLSVHELAARFSAIDGERLPLPEAAPATMRVRSTLFALHEGLFADWWLRWLYVISGLLGCAVIGTGLVLWTVKRGQQHQRLQPFAVQTVYRHSSHVS
ncbi:MAG TPA: PepSY-associated TM helix domain-containing protein [Achromobacter sp.]|uniref:PepSY-associated TM helix domain-containing protein n=1 Tax=Achromobacter sp. TaxID=134375 RepID=UPI002F92C28F